VETLSPEYVAKTPESRRLYLRAKKVFAGGVNHNARSYSPYPLYLKGAKGQHVWDEDGNRYVDYWMGHMALILGHSPRIVVEALREQVGRGTHYGMGSRLSLELGEEIQRSVPCAEMLRFCNTGAEATMYLVRLARAFTKRRTVVKIAGGWHGYNTELNKGVHRPFDRAEGEGILPAEQSHLVTVRFNDLEAAEKAVRGARDDMAVVFLEPVLGAGGCIPADPDYLKGLRDLTGRAGALLAFDEIITGYRLSLGGAQERYGVKPDLAALGKVVGGGLPIGLVCGLKEVVSMADPSRRERFVSIGGGTFSENPLSMAAGLATTRFLRRNRGSVYPRLEEEGRFLRSGVDRAFEEQGIQAHTTGMGSLFLTHFGEKPTSAEHAEDGALASDYSMRLLSSGVFLIPGHAGAISTAHKKGDIERLIRVSRGFASDKRAGAK
jgi:glutamate-1-semialdehyde 2,1-aminomutase